MKTLPHQYVLLEDNDGRVEGTTISMLSSRQQATSPLYADVRAFR